MTARPIICFDLDGCLVDSRRAITGSMNHALVALGADPLPPRALATYIGPPLRGVVDGLLASAGLPGATTDDVDAFIAAYRDHYASEGIALTALVEGMDDVLRQLGPAMTCGVVTSKPRRYARPVVAQVGLTDLLAFVEGPRSGAEDEVKEGTLRRALAEHGADDATPVAMIGDRAHDIVAGHAVAVTTIGVLWGVGTREELEEAHADHLVAEVADLAPLVERVVGR